MKKAMIIILVGILLLSVFTVLLPVGICEASEAIWEKTFSSRFDNIFAPVQQTSDGGYIIAGAGTWGSSQLIKTDKNGNEEWAKTFDGQHRSVQQTSDWGYIITGYNVMLPAGYYVIELIKTDPDGEQDWVKTFRRSDSFVKGNFVMQTSDGGYIIAGDTADIEAEGSFVIYDIWLIKTDSTGNEIWNKTFGGNGNDTAFQVKQTKDGGYILVGSTDSYGVTSSYFGVITDNVWVLKTDSSGNEQWNKTFGGIEEDQGYSIQQTRDDGYIITGVTHSYGVGDGDVWLIKTDANGEMEWNRTYSPVTELMDSTDTGYSVQQTSDGGFIIVGDTQSRYGTHGTRKKDIWLIKTNSTGEELWNKTFGTNNDDHGYSVQQTSDGGYIIGGRTHPDLTSANILLMKVGGTAENQLPVADVNGPYSGKVGENIVFDASKSSDSDGTVEYYCWDWDNDGLWDTGWKTTPIIEKKYYSSGNYTVKLEIKDNNGGTNTAITSVTIKETSDEHNDEIANGNNEDSTDKNAESETPGFELVLAICAIALFSFLKRKRMI